ncbi:MAG TPA: YkgJ family cysteine cluster protein [Thermoplasmata archaeon]|nr:YkgJ family cysteine cluster protein [Thermoplasmata archaeon]
MVTPPELDESLLAGFSFACRPGCALCCFAEPAVTPAERPRLLRIAPDLEFRPGAAGLGFIPSRSDGGACRLLRDLRCSAHDARPFPCRTFPITVFLGSRPQATLVLSCPGLVLTTLASPPSTPTPPAPVGLGPELESVRSELGAPRAVRRILGAQHEYDAARRRLTAEGRWEDIGMNRGRIVERGLGRVRSSFPAPLPEEAEHGLDHLPFTFDGELGRVAFSGTPDGWRLIALQEEGGPGAVAGTYPEPDRPPRLEAGGQELLRGYLSYVLARESFSGQLMLRLLEDASGRMDESAEEEVGFIAADVLTRASILERAHGRTGDRLDVEAVAAGIRATDAEVLDQPHVGDVL